MNNALKAVWNYISQYQSKTGNCCSVLNIEKNQMTSDGSNDRQKQIPISTVGYIECDQLTLMLEGVDINRRDVRIGQTGTTVFTKQMSNGVLKPTIATCMKCAHQVLTLHA